MPSFSFVQSKYKIITLYGNLFRGNFEAVQKYLQASEDLKNTIQGQKNEDKMARKALKKELLKDHRTKKQQDKEQMSKEQCQELR